MELKSSSYGFFAFIKDVLELIRRYQTLVFSLLAITFVSVGGYYLYGYTTTRREERAHAALVESMRYFNARVGEIKDTEIAFDEEVFPAQKAKWEATAKIFKGAYDMHQSSNLGGIFLAYQSEALIRLGNLDEARSVLASALSSIKDRSLRYLYEVKLALMDIDSGKQDAINKGLGVLTSIVSNKQADVVADLALYRLGEYYWVHKNFDAAKDFWNQLMLKYGDTSKSPSPWAAKAQEYLALVQV